MDIQLYTNILSHDYMESYQPVIGWSSIQDVDHVNNLHRSKKAVDEQKYLLESFKQEYNKWKTLSWLWVRYRNYSTINTHYIFPRYFFGRRFFNKHNVFPFEYNDNIIPVVICINNIFYSMGQY